LIENKDRLLYTISSHTDFCIAKCLRELSDCDLYGYFDTNFVNDKFPKEQKMLDFIKTWNYEDNVIIKERSEIDLKYLRNFENQYDINLWLIAFAERAFYKYNNYYKYTENEILSILEQECKFFERMLDEINPDFFIVGHQSPHDNFLLEKLCNARGITILKLVLTGLGNRTEITTNKKIFSTKTEHNAELKNEIDFQEPKDFLKKFDYTKQIKDYVYDLKKINRKKQFKEIVKFFLLPQFNSHKIYTTYGRTKFKTLRLSIKIAIEKRKIKKFVKHHSIYNIEKSTPFVYFPLHSEPEKALLIDSPYYLNQIELINQIAKSLPVGFKLLVKDHPETKIQGRSVSFYKNITNLPNVKLINPFVSRDKILSQSSLVITIAGTTGLEASFFEKPVIVLSDTDYSHLSSVYRLKSLEDLPQIINSSLKSTVSISELKEYANNIYQNSFDYNPMTIKSDVIERFFVKGLELIPKGNSNQEMKSFFQDNKSIFNKLALEYLKKIKLCKSSNP
jgi:hypothetical protein